MLKIKKIESYQIIKVLTLDNGFEVLADRFDYHHLFFDTYANVKNQDLVFACVNDAGGKLIVTPVYSEPEPETDAVKCIGFKAI